MARKRKTGKPYGRTARAAAGGGARHGADDGRETELRIVGGEFRGRRLRYHGDPTVRPMKHRTREAIFNLVTTEVKGRHAIDLFAGTGALGLEALSRGAVGATFIEKHVPSARVVEENIRTLAVEDRTVVLVTSAFLWARRDISKERGAGSEQQEAGSGEHGADSGEQLALHAPRSPLPAPWLVFCCPPYAFYEERLDEMLALVGAIQEHAPPGSVLVVEADGRFDFGLLASTWDVRGYSPAVVGIWRAGE